MLCAEGSGVSTFNPLNAQRFVSEDRGSLPQSVRQWQGNSSIYDKHLPAMLEGMGRLVCLERVYQNAISVPKFADYWFIYFRFGWPGIQMFFYHSAISAF